MAVSFTDLKQKQTKYSCKQEANMATVLEQFAERTQIDANVMETELFAALRAMEVDPKDMTIEDLRECLLIYLDEVFYGISPERGQ